MKNDNSTKTWMKRGLSYSIFMYIMMELIAPLMFREEYSMKRLLIMIPIWALAGAGYEYMMKLIEGRKRKQMESNEDAPQ